MTETLNPPTSRRFRRGRLAALGLAALAVLGACGSDGGSSDSADTTAAPGTEAAAPAESTSAAPATDAPASTEPVTLRLGYFPNVTHATALVGVGKGIFEEHLGDNVTLETSTFSTGTEASEALFADAIDMTYIGPNPAINAYAKSNGEAVRIISGATSGGAFLVVKPEITDVEGLQGQDAGHAQPGQHPGRGPAVLAQGERPGDRRGRWRRREHRPAGEQPDAADLRVR